MVKPEILIPEQIGDLLSDEELALEIVEWTSEQGRMRGSQASLPITGGLTSENKRYITWSLGKWDGRRRIQAPSLGWGANLSRGGHTSHCYRWTQR